MKKLCLTGPKNFVGESFSVSLNSGIKKFMDKKGDGGSEYQNFPSKVFCLTVPKDFVGEAFSVSLTSGVEKVHG